MHDQSIAGEAGASAPGRSVSGLGVCDVWRVELSAVQWPWLVDELEAARGPLEEALQRAWAEQAVDDGEAVAENVAAREYELRLVVMMRAQLPAHDHEEGVVFVGPADLLRELVSGTLRRVVDALGDCVDAQRLTDAESRERLVVTAEAAEAWARTFVECQKVETFHFDPDADPMLLR
ncbi:MAG: hypothetical protein ACRDPC_00315 [Solirubrobacteraceae bacterium]